MRIGYLRPSSPLPADGVQKLRDRMGSGVFWTALGHFGTEGLRLIGNIALAYLLFPEAFGMMALVTAVLVGLQLFSDVGVAPAIQRSPRGDDPAFLNTAWTIQVLRGFVLWLLACAIAQPVAHFYATPELALFLPVAGLSLIVAGFRPTRHDTASRHLRMQRVTLVNLGAQTVALVVIIALSLALRSVWALAIGMVITATLRVLALHLFMPGHVDRLRIERSAAAELVHFGKWIFLSTACAFAISQGDRLVLGQFVTLETLGVFGIGLMIGSFPRMLGMTLLERLMISIYRDLPPTESPENLARLRRFRALFTAGLMALVLLLALTGPWLVTLLYDDRYSLAGPVVVLVACIVLLQLVGMSYDRAALAAGDSRGFFWLQALRAVLHLLGLISGAYLAGLGGALAGQAAAVILSYAMQVRLARKHGVWDMQHDLFTILSAAITGASVIWLHFDKVVQLFQ